MAEDAGEDAAFAFLKSPHHRLVFAVNARGREHFDLARVTCERPIRFVQEMNLAGQTVHDRVVVRRDDFQIEGRVAILGARG